MSSYQSEYVEAVEDVLQMVTRRLVCKEYFARHDLLVGREARHFSPSHEILDHVWKEVERDWAERNERGHALYCGPDVPAASETAADTISNLSITDDVRVMMDLEIRRKSAKIVVEALSVHELESLIIDAAGSEDLDTAFAKKICEMACDHRESEAKARIEEQFKSATS